MSDGRTGFLYRDLTQHARAELGQRCVNYAKTLPQGATANLFTISAPIIVTGLFGVIGTVWGASTKLGIGVTGVANCTRWSTYDANRCQWPGRLRWHVHR
jgi:hypothetical protein